MWTAGSFFYYNKVMNKGFWQKGKDKVENVLPMTLNSFLLFAFVIYLIFIVGKSVYRNYQSNLDIVRQEQEVLALKRKIEIHENEIAYYKTNAYKERQAREKLGFKAQGESVISLPLDLPADEVADLGGSEPTIKTPNYRLWASYFTEYPPTKLRK